MPKRNNNRAGADRPDGLESSGWMVRVLAFPVRWLVKIYKWVASEMGPNFFSAFYFIIGAGVVSLIIWGAYSFLHWLMPGAVGALNEIFTAVIISFMQALFLLPAGAVIFFIYYHYFYAGAKNGNVYAGIGFYVFILFPLLFVFPFLVSKNALLSLGAFGRAPNILPVSPLFLGQYLLRVVLPFIGGWKPGALSLILNVFNSCTFFLLLYASYRLWYYFGVDHEGETDVITSGGLIDSLPRSIIYGIIASAAGLALAASSVYFFSGRAGIQNNGIENAALITDKYRTQHTTKDRSGMTTTTYTYYIAYSFKPYGDHEGPVNQSRAVSRQLWNVLEKGKKLVLRLDPVNPSNNLIVFSKTYEIDPAYDLDIELPLGLALGGMAAFAFGVYCFSTARSLAKKH